MRHGAGDRLKFPERSFSSGHCGEKSLLLAAGTQRRSHRKIQARNPKLETISNDKNTNVSNTVICADDIDYGGRPNP